MSVKYCTLCQRQVVPSRRFSVVWFLVWFILGAGVGGVVYFIYYLLKKKQCPICHSKTLISVAKVIPSNN